MKINILIIFALFYPLSVHALSAKEILNKNGYITGALLNEFIGDNGLSACLKELCEEDGRLKKLRNFNSTDYHNYSAQQTWGLYVNKKTDNQFCMVDVKFSRALYKTKRLGLPQIIHELTKKVTSLLEDGYYHVQV